MKLNYNELLANTLKSELGVISEGFFTGIAVMTPPVPEGYVTPDERIVVVTDRNDTKYKITIEEIE